MLKVTTASACLASQKELARYTAGPVARMRRCIVDDSDELRPGGADRRRNERIKHVRHKRHDCVDLIFFNAAHKLAAQAAHAPQQTHRIAPALNRVDNLKPVAKMNEIMKTLVLARNRDHRIDIGPRTCFASEMQNEFRKPATPPIHKHDAPLAELASI